MFTRRSNLRLAALFASAALAACSAEGDDPNDMQSDALSGPENSGSDDKLAIAADAASIALRDERSLVITSPAALAAIEKRFSFGKVMERIGKAAATPGAMGVDEDGNPVPKAKEAADYTPNEWVDHVFGTAAKDFDEHTNAPAKARLGLVPTHNPLQHLRDLWSGRNGTLDSRAQPAPSLGDGPFRLLAVVNRLDLAGDVDSRDCCTGAARVARPFGEGRLVFGLVDPDMEGRANPKPYPLTIIVEFRLPGLNANLDVVRDDYPYKDALTNDAEWRSQMERWGEIWQEQSRLAPNDPKSEKRLGAIISRFAQPQNFLSIRSGFQVEDARGNTEFEYREWYILRGATHLIPRKPRREPYRCGSEGSTLTDIVESQWVDAKGDLQMRGINAAGKSTSYDFPRDERGFAAQNGPMRGCAQDANGKGIPFEMDGQSPISNVPVQVDTAPFARFGRNDVWTLFQPSGTPAEREDKRHQFAIRSCSGCHGKEAGLFGFQIGPRLKGQESKLADFMTGKGGVQFSHDGADYHYDDLAGRHAFVVKAAKRDSTLELYSGLWRHDRT